MTEKPEPLGEEEMVRLRRHAEYLKTLPSSSVKNSAFGLELIGLLATIDAKDARIRELEQQLDERKHDQILYKWKDDPGGHVCPSCDAPKGRGHYDGCESPHADLMVELARLRERIRELERELDDARAMAEDPSYFHGVRGGKWRGEGGDQA